MKLVYQAADGQLFSNKVDCENHEIKYCFAPLTSHIERHCKTSYNDDCGFEIYGLEDIERYILNHYNYISDYINKLKKMENV